MSSALTFEIITPEKVTYTGQALSITLPTAAGQITVLPGHIPLVSPLVAGEVIIRDGKSEAYFAVSNGLAQINASNIKILTSSAEQAEEIDEARAEQARQRALKLMTERRDDVDYAALSAKIEKELARLKVVRSRRRTHQNSPRPYAEE